MRALTLGHAGDVFCGKIDRKPARFYEVAAVRLEPERAAGARKKTFRDNDIRLGAGGGQRPLLDLRAPSAKQQDPVPLPASQPH